MQTTRRVIATSSTAAPQHLSLQAPSSGERWHGGAALVRLLRRWRREASREVIRHTAGPGGGPVRYGIAPPTRTCHV